jgi:CubicO group peptidase (beta-lactamase class C family)
MRIRWLRFVLVSLVASWLAEWAAGDELSPQLEQRIAAVEKGLIPAVRVKGRTTPTSIADRLARDHVPGVSVAVINNYQIEWAKGYGTADATAGTPVTGDTLFQAASMSKPVTALAALKLVEQGMLDLDSDVNKQLKSWHVPENEFTREHAVDLRGLLSHTAGLTVHGFPGYNVEDPLPTVPQILDGMKPANTAPVRVNKAPGQGFRYSGGGTTIVQLLLTDVTQRRFADLMRDMVLGPLAMSASTFEQPLPEHRWSQAATAHDEQGKPIAGRWHIYPEQAPAGLWTTPSDMARYAIEVQLAHEGKSAKVLSREMTDKMLTPQGDGPVGLGPFLVARGATRRFEHSGGNEGFRCHYVALLDRGQGAVVMTNADSGNRTVNEITNSIAVAYSWPDFLPPEREVAQVDRRLFDRMVGDYALNVTSVASVARRGDRLFIKLPRQAEIELYPQSELEFFAELPEVSGKCVLDQGGKIEAIEFKLDGREVRGRRVP